MSLKRDEYFAAGVRLVWEIDPEARTVTEYTSPTNRRVLAGNDSLDGGDVLPEFRLRVAEIFVELDRRR